VTNPTDVNNAVARAELQITYSIREGASVVCRVQHDPALKDKQNHDGEPSSPTVFTLPLRIDAHQTASPAAAAYWLYQNAWVVAGAQMGWWHGAEALQTLIAVDRRTQSLWGMGAKSASAAQQALVEVRAKAKS